MAAFTPNTIKGNHLFNALDKDLRTDVQIGSELVIPIREKLKKLREERGNITDHDYSVCYQHGGYVQEYKDYYEDWSKKPNYDNSQEYGNAKSKYDTAFNNVRAQSTREGKRRLKAALSEMFAAACDRPLYDYLISKGKSEVSLRWTKINQIEREYWNLIEPRL